MVKNLVFAGLCLGIILGPSLAFSEEAASEYSYGTLVEIKKEANEIVISEYDWDNDKEVMVTYTVHPDAKIENTDSWKSIPNGSYVDIEYVADKDGKRTANFISVYKPEEAPEEAETE